MPSEMPSNERSEAEKSLWIELAVFGEPVATAQLMESFPRWLTLLVP